MAIVNKTLFVLLGLVLYFSFINAAENPAVEKPKEAKAEEDKLVSIKEAPVALQKLGEGVLKWLQQQQKLKSWQKDIFQKASFRYNKEKGLITLQADVREFMVYGRELVKAKRPPWTKTLQKEIGPDAEGIIITLKVEHVNAARSCQLLSKIYPGAYWDMYMDIIGMVDPQYSIDLRVYELEIGSRFDLAALSKEVKRLADDIGMEKIKAAVK